MKIKMTTLFILASLVMILLTTAPAQKQSAKAIEEHLAYVPVILNNFNSLIPFFDDFSDDTSGWYVGENAIEHWQYTANERYEGRVKEPGYIVFERAPILADNYVLQAESYPTNLAEQGTQGLVFGLSEDWSEFYYFKVTPTSPGFYSFNKLTAAGWTTLRDWTEYPVSSTHNTLKVVRDGTRIDLYINDSLVDTVDDGQLTGFRYVGVAVSSYSSTTGTVINQFDNFSVDEIAGRSHFRTANTTNNRHLKSLIEELPAKIPTTPKAK